MKNTTSKLNTNPFIAFLNEQAQAKGMTLDEFCKPLGYTPKVIEALDENPWIKPSATTLAVLANIIGEDNEELEYQISLLWNPSTLRGAASELSELVNLYETLPARGRRQMVQDVRRRAERFFRTQERKGALNPALDAQAGLNEIQEFYGSLPDAMKEDFFQLIRLAHVRYQTLVKKEEDLRLGFNLHELDDVL